MNLRAAVCRRLARLSRASLLHARPLIHARPPIHARPLIHAQPLGSSAVGDGGDAAEMMWTRTPATHARRTSRADAFARDRAASDSRPMRADGVCHQKGKSECASWRPAPSPRAAAARPAAVCRGPGAYEHDRRQASASPVGTPSQPFGAAFPGTGKPASASDGGRSKRPGGPRRPATRPNRAERGRGRRGRDGIESKLT